MSNDLVTEYLRKHAQWQPNLALLRERLLLSELQETIKWGMPTYCLENKNVVGLGAFKHHYGLWFFNGSAMQDPDGVLVNAQQGKTKHMRHWRFGKSDKLNLAFIDKYIGLAISTHYELKAKSS